MDRLSVFKALGDNTRFAIYRELVTAAAPLSTGDIADRLDLHVNTVRPHLERMREVGLLELRSESQGSVGRPQHRWSLAVQAPSLGLEPSAFRLLARLLAEVAATSGVDADQIAAIGQAQGRLQAQAAVSAFGTRTPIRCLDVLLTGLSQLGFDPVLGDLAGDLAGEGEAHPEVAGSVAPAEGGAVDSHGNGAGAGSGNGAGAEVQGTSIGFARCPFRELAEAFPDLVCHLHRGIVEGLVDASPGGELTVSGFADILDPDPCRVGLSVR